MTATMVAAIEPEAKVSARRRVRAWVREQIEARGDVRAPDIAGRAREELAKDRELMADFGAEMLTAAIYELTLDVIASTRDVGSVDAYAERAESSRGTDSRAALQRRLSRLEQQYGKWREHVGDRHVRLLDMTAADLAIAEAERRARGLIELRRADFLAALAERLGENETVKKLSIAQIEELRLASMAKMDDESPEDTE